MRNGSYGRVVSAAVYPPGAANIGRTNNVRLYKFLTSSDGINYVRAAALATGSRYLANGALAEA